MYSKLWSSDAWCSETVQQKFGAIDNKYACNLCIELTELAMFLQKHGDPVGVPSNVQPSAVILKYQPWISSAAWDDWKTEVTRTAVR